jgi:uncharacterized protein YrzB (UPF0473 family)
MEQEKDNRITITKDDGIEEEYRILLTYHSDKYNGDFMLVYAEDTPDDVLLFQYYEDGKLDAIFDEEILKEAQSVLDKFDEEVESETI